MLVAMVVGLLVSEGRMVFSGPSLMSLDSRRSFLMCWRTASGVAPVGSYFGGVGSGMGETDGGWGCWGGWGGGG